MDFLTNANDFMPIVLGAFFILAVLAVSAEDRSFYWGIQEEGYEDRPHYEFSLRRAARLARAWKRVKWLAIGLLVVIVGYFLFLTSTHVPPALYY